MSGLCNKPARSAWERSHVFLDNISETPENSSTLPKPVTDCSDTLKPLTFLSDPTRSCLRLVIRVVADVSRSFPRCLLNVAIGGENLAEVAQVGHPAQIEPRFSGSV